MEETADLETKQAPSPTDRGKRAAQSPAKLPPVKKQHGAETCCLTTNTLPAQFLAAFPTSDNSASEHSLKAMLLSLQDDMQKVLRSSITHVHERIDLLEERTECIKQHLSSATAAHNAVVDTKDEQAEAIRQLRLKLTDLEDRSRQNNIKIRGVPESVNSA